MTRSLTAPVPVGTLIRKWRKDRNVSQLALASRANVSARHLSFLETGRATPSRAMIVHLADHLRVPLRERNQMLLAAGFAPIYSENSLDAPQLSMIRTAVLRLLSGHDPYPAVVVDAGWNLVAGNDGVAMLTEGAPDDLLTEPFNVLRFSLHPRGLAPKIVNLRQWRTHLLERLERQIHSSGGDARLVSLYSELLTYPESNALGNGDSPDREHDEVIEHPDVFLPLKVRLDDEVVLSFFSTVTTFGTPQDVTVEELQIEQFYPADKATEDFLRSR